MTTETKYNGWTNYETWRVNLEVFDGFNPDEYYSSFNPENVYELGQSLKDYAEQVIFECSDIPSGLARDYAQAFIDAVNFYEIANHMVLDYLQEQILDA
jgi:hypothetical protein